MIHLYYLIILILSALIGTFTIYELNVNRKNKKKINDLESIIKVIRKELFGLMYSKTTKEHEDSTPTHDHCVSECKHGIHQWRCNGEYNELFDWLICKECGIKCLCLKKYIDDKI